MDDHNPALPADGVDGANGTAQTATPLLQLAKDYVRLGGRRRSVVDDNVVSTRDWEADSSEAAAFWRDRVETLGADERKQVELYLPTINAT